jgi:hypothetical protein
MISQPLQSNRHIAIVNIALILTALCGLVVYVIAANGLASQAWQAADAQDRLTTILDERNDLVAQQSEFEDRSRLTELAHRVGMVPAGAVVYLMQEKPVAAR